ncbi:hypothetical protein PPL_01821 [Heterostelium album PN500]|uniref:Ankyrin repeat protein n=1 Tax=Heterostelium pallidum (strain ATCC 26659 / Pp 5 / PN500) TaxID=670386 RepID=D3B0K4_HETP5|nr:hypothetical protein PPL_01821 [Heterostelium album PN500]EFA84828.1 hypothetical protein PPL_01821 [Heterostelium album PN500]|eukprot:XP_020436939.1 hypothetical protein PPL_01821 [Heterostelium album PN500]
MNLKSTVCVYYLNEKETVSIYDPDTSYGKDDFTQNRYRWSDVRSTPKVLAGNGYIQYLKEHFKKNSIRLVSSQDKIAMLRNAIRANRLDVLRYIVEELRVKLDEDKDISQVYDLMYFASIYSGSDHTIIEYLASFDKEMQWNYLAALGVSPFSLNMETVKYFTKRLQLIQEEEEEDKEETGKSYFSLLNPNVFNCAARVGRIDMIEWLVRNRPQDRANSSMYFQAVSNNHVHVLDYLGTENSDSYGHSILMDVAALTGSLKTLKWLHYNNYGECTASAIDNAALSNSLDIIKWLNENRTEGATTLAMDNAAYKGNLKIVKYLHFNRTEGCTSYAFEAAKVHGDTEMLTWLRENRTEAMNLNANV